MNTLIQVTKSGTIFSGKEEDLKQMRTEFDQNHYLRLPKLLEPELLDFIKSYVDQTEFIEGPNPQGLGTETCIKENPASHLLHFLMNDQKLYQIIEEITGCKKIGCFDGRIYYINSHHKSYDRWHNDDGRTRMITLSINLSSGIYSGGILKIRNAESKTTLHEIPNTGFGDAIIFRIAPYLEHMVSDVEGSVSKIAYAGWFHEEPNHHSLVQKRFSELRTEIAQTPNTENFLLKHSIVTQQEGYFSHAVNGKTVIFKPEDTSYFSLNTIGSRIWSLIQKPISVSKIKDIILNEYDVEPDQCEEDVVSLLDKLAANKLITAYNKELVSSTQ